MQFSSRTLRRLAPLGALALIGVAAARFLKSRTPAPHHPALSHRAERDSGRDGPVRPAGPEAMRDPPSRWSEEDEASDESFPASDPAAKY